MLPNLLPKQYTEYTIKSKKPRNQYKVRNCQSSEQEVKRTQFATPTPSTIQIYVSLFGIMVLIDCKMGDAQNRHGHPHDKMVRIFAHFMTFLIVSKKI